jgi:GH24 family phage-related lysozyme (muramidase)
VKDGTNWYNYVANRPLMLVDPMGLIKINGVEVADNWVKNIDGKNYVGISALVTLGARRVGNETFPDGDYREIIFNNTKGGAIPYFDVTINFYPSMDFSTYKSQSSREFGSGDAIGMYLEIDYFEEIMCVLGIGTSNVKPVIIQPITPKPTTVPPVAITPGLYGNMAFTGTNWLALAEGNIPYIYSTKTPGSPPWTGGFSATADLTFGIGHSIKTASEFNQIANFINTHSTTDIANEVQRYLQNDLSSAVQDVNNFLQSNQIHLKQHQFDAIVSLVYNYPAALSSTSDLGMELINNGATGNFNQANIITGFTYTVFQGSRIDGLTTRRNNELNLFFTGNYNNYYDSKTKVTNAGIAYIPY